MNNYLTYNSIGTYDISRNFGNTIIVNNSLEIRTGKNLLLSPVTIRPGGLTVSFWIKIPEGTVNGSYDMIFEFSDGNLNTNYFSMFFSPVTISTIAKNRLAIAAVTNTNGGTTGTDISASIMNTNTVYHVVWRITDNGSQVAENKVFLNNAIVYNENHFYQQASTRNFPYIGRSHFGTQSQYDASFNMYDFRLYNRKLPDADISSIYNYGSGIYT